MRNFLWSVALFSWVVIMGMYLDFVKFGPASYTSRIAAGIGFGGIIFLCSGLIPLLVLALQKFNPKKQAAAMVLWAIILMTMTSLIAIGSFYTPR
jgi:hypothetical protein